MISKIWVRRETATLGLVPSIPPEREWVDRGRADVAMATTPEGNVFQAAAPVESTETPNDLREIRTKATTEPRRTRTLGDWLRFRTGNLLSHESPSILVRYHSGRLPCGPRARAISTAARHILIYQTQEPKFVLYAWRYSELARHIHLGRPDSLYSADRNDTLEGRLRSDQRRVATVSAPRHHAHRTSTTPGRLLVWSMRARAMAKISIIRLLASRRPRRYR